MTTMPQRESTIAAPDDGRKQLGAFLRARRESLDPQRLGLPRVGRRRTPGLRREEVAMLAEVGVIGSVDTPPYAGNRRMFKAFRYFENRIEAMLEGLQRFGWSPVEENGFLIGLERRNAEGFIASVSLEPGGQFELSGAPLLTIHDICSETGQHLEEVKTVADEIASDSGEVDLAPEDTDDEPVTAGQDEQRSEEPAAAAQPTAETSPASEPEPAPEPSPAPRRRGGRRGASSSGTAVSLQPVDLTASTSGGQTLTTVAAESGDAATAPTADPEPSAPTRRKRKRVTAQAGPPKADETDQG